MLVSSFVRAHNLQLVNMNIEMNRSNLDLPPSLVSEDLLDNEGQSDNGHDHNDSNSNQDGDDESDGDVEGPTMEAHTVLAAVLCKYS
jgi:hypothetical protein